MEARRPASLPLGEIPLTDEEFEGIRALVYAHSRIALRENKRELVKSRLAKRLRATGHASYGAYLDSVIDGPAGSEELVYLLDAISTNKTEFFREREHFVCLADRALPEITARKRAAGSRRLRLWSAACSSGEEPYTIAITVLESLGADGGWDAKILATDISTRMLRAGQRGVYSQEALAPVPPLLRRKYFRSGTGRDGDECAVTAPLRDLVTFRRLNLHVPRFPFHGRFDVIFCRNVMIYFDKPTQAELVQKLYDVLEPGGYLFIGHSESLIGLDTAFRPVRPTVYRRGS